MRYEVRKNENPKDFAYYVYDTAKECIVSGTTSENEEQTKNLAGFMNQIEEEIVKNIGKLGCSMPKLKTMDKLR